MRKEIGVGLIAAIMLMVSMLMPFANAGYITINSTTFNPANKTHSPVTTLQIDVVVYDSNESLTQYYLDWDGTNQTLVNLTTELQTNAAFRNTIYGVDAGWHTYRLWFKDADNQTQTATANYYLEGYASSDLGPLTVDLIAKFGVALVALAAIFGVVMLYRYLSGQNIM